MAAAPQAEEAIINEPIDMIRLSLDDRVYVKCRYGIAASNCLEADRGRSPSAPVLLLLPCRDGSHPGRQVSVALRYSAMYMCQVTVCRCSIHGSVFVVQWADCFDQWRPPLSCCLACPQPAAFCILEPTNPRSME